MGFWLLLGYIAKPTIHHALIHSMPDVSVYFQLLTEALNAGVQGILSLPCLSTIHPSPGLSYQGFFCKIKFCFTVLSCLGLVLLAVCNVLSSLPHDSSLKVKTAASNGNCRFISLFSCKNRNNSYALSAFSLFIPTYSFRPPTNSTSLGTHCVLLFLFLNICQGIIRKIGSSLYFKIIYYRELVTEELEGCKK